MPTIIDCAQWDFSPERLETGFQQNSGQALTTESILASMEDLRARPEMNELAELIKASSQYAPGKKHA